MSDPHFKLHSSWKPPEGEGMHFVRVPPAKKSLAVRAMCGAEAGKHAATNQPTESRDLSARDLYARAALEHIPHLLGAIDRNPYHATYGCLDRQFWHYRTADFPCGMHQEGALPLAQVYAYDLPGNVWHAEPRVRELAIAALRFAAISSRPDGSCDDYFPGERALGAAVFTLQAAARAYEILRLDDAEIRTFIARRARWVMAHGETGNLTNHHALAALGLAHAARVTGDEALDAAARKRVEQVLAWQDSEGWFDEYDGADPGYQTATLECLAQLRRLWNASELDEPLRRGLAFARLFLHPDGSYGGEYGSRGTHHFYPHGCELLARENSDAADLADGFLTALATRRTAYFNDDRLVAHRLASLIDAWRDFAPRRPLESSTAGEEIRRYLPHAGLAVVRTDRMHLVAAAQRGGVWKWFRDDAPPRTDAGLVIELEDGRVVVSQQQSHCRTVEFHPGSATTDEPGSITVSGPLHFARHETATPLKQIVFRVLTLTLGRLGRDWLRRMLQRRLITGRREAPVRMTRRIEWLSGGEFSGPGPDDGGPRLRVVDEIELTSPSVRIRRMSFGSDHHSAYVAASNVYQAGVLCPWTDLTDEAATLNARRRVTLVREFS